MVANVETLDKVQSATDKYKYGFVTDIEMCRLRANGQ